MELSQNRKAWPGDSKGILGGRPIQLPALDAGRTVHTTSPPLDGYYPPKAIYNAECGTTTVHQNLMTAHLVKSRILKPWIRDSGTGRSTVDAGTSAEVQSNISYRFNHYRHDRFEGGKSKMFSSAILNEELDR